MCSALIQFVVASTMFFVTLPVKVVTAIPGMSKALWFGTKAAMKAVKKNPLETAKKMLNPLWVLRKAYFVAVVAWRHVFPSAVDPKTKSVSRWMLEAADPDAFERLDDRYKSYSKGGQDVHEILSLIPETAAKGSNPYGDVLELACGTGRFTEVIMRSADSVIAADLVPSFVDKCREIFASKPNGNIVQFRAADARDMRFPDESFDVVFWSWLMMYFNDEDTAAFLARVQRWIKPGGCLVFREAVAGSDKSYDEYETTVNGEQCRPPEFYTNIASKITSLQFGGLHTLKSLEQETERFCWVYRKPM